VTLKADVHVRTDRVKKPREGREAAAPSNIKEFQEIQGGQEAPHDGDAFNPKDAYVASFRLKGLINPILNTRVPGGPK